MGDSIVSSMQQESHRGEETKGRVKSAEDLIEVSTGMFSRATNIEGITFTVPSERARQKGWSCSELESQVIGCDFVWISEYLPGEHTYLDIGPCCRLATFIVVDSGCSVTIKYFILPLSCSS